MRTKKFILGLVVVTGALVGGASAVPDKSANQAGENETPKNPGGVGQLVLAEGESFNCDFTFTAPDGSSSATAHGNCGSNTVCSGEGGVSKGGFAWARVVCLPIPID